MVPGSNLTTPAGSKSFQIKSYFNQESPQGSYSQPSSAAKDSSGSEFTVPFPPNSSSGVLRFKFEDHKPSLDEKATATPAKTPSVSSVKSLYSELRRRSSPSSPLHQHTPGTPTDSSSFNESAGNSTQNYPNEVIIYGFPLDLTQQLLSKYVLPIGKVIDYCFTLKKGEQGANFIRVKFQSPLDADVCRARLNGRLVEFTSGNVASSSGWYSGGVGNFPGESPQNLSASRSSRPYSRRVSSPTAGSGLSRYSGSPLGFNASFSSSVNSETASPSSSGATAKFMIGCI